MTQEPYGLAATDYLERGWSPFPLPPGEKSPPPTGFTGHAGRDVTGEDVARWCNGARLSDGSEARAGNIAVRAPDNVLFLDVDNYDDKTGGQTLATKLAKLGKLPKTVRSTSRDDTVSGLHAYRVPARRRWVDRLGPGVEVVSHGHRYAMCWPSVHPRSPDAIYRWLDARNDRGEVPVVADLPKLPPAWVKELDRGAAGAAVRADSTGGAALLADLQADKRPACPALQRQVDQLRDNLRAGVGRHDLTRNAVMALVRLGEQGHFGTAQALNSAGELFVASLSGEDADRTRGASTEWDRILTGAAGKVAADVTPADELGCCGEHARRDPRFVEFVAAPRAADELFLAADFWQARDFLRHVHTCARARGLAPWAVFGAMLARAAASVPPSLVLPPTIGAPASLNLFVGLVGESGAGKSAALSLAEDRFEPTGGTANYLSTQPGSGEGLLAAYCHTPRGGKKGKAPKIVQHRISVLFDIDEVAALRALADRKGATLGPFLKTAWSGRSLGTQNADPSRIRRVESHRYRLVVVSGIQPAHADVILDDAEGGFPQRWLWLPTWDPEGTAAPRGRPIPAPLCWRVPGTPVEIVEDGGDSDGGTELIWPQQTELSLPGVATAAIHEASAARNVRIGSVAAAGGLDGHALLNRAKVAALLALIENRLGVSVEDWELSGQVMAVSDATRADVQAVRGVSARREADHTAKRRGRSDALADTAASDHKVVLAMGNIRRGLVKAGGEVSRGNARKFVPSRNYEFSDEALARLVESGEVTRVERENARGKMTVYYALAVKP